MNKQEHEALRLCVESLDQLMPYLAKVPADVGLLNDALVAARPLLKQEPAPAQDEREAFIAAAKHHKVEGLGFNLEATNSGSFRDNETRMLHEGWKLARSTRPAQTEQQPEQSGKFAMHQRVRKTSGSEWQGRICGTYSTALTPEGYAVESEAHAGSVQIYPVKALEAAPKE